MQVSRDAYERWQKEYNTRVFQCIQCGDLENLKESLALKHINNPIKDGWSALMHACLAGNDDIVKYLLEHGAEATENFEFFTPLMTVCSASGHVYEEKLVACAKLLISHGAKVDDMDRYKTTALMIAARAGHEKLVSYLIEAGCDVNKMDNDGMSALHLAVTFNHLSIVRILLESGADKLLKDRRGRDALSVAITKGLEDMIKLLHIPENKEEANDDVEPVKKTSFELLLSQLPGYNSSNRKVAENGFHEDVGTILQGVGLGQYTDLFLAKKVGIAQLLNITDKELKEIGVLFSSHREKIMDGNLRFILRAWGSGSLLGVTSDSHIEMMDIVRSMANNVKHLHLLWASSTYCKERVILESEDQKVDDLYQVTLRTYNQTETLINELRRIQQRVKKVQKYDKVTAIDLILPKQHHKISVCSKLAAVSIIVGLLAWKTNVFRLLK